MNIAELKNNKTLRNQYIEDNIDLIYHVYSKLPINDFTIKNKEDLVHEGLIGFIEAIDHFEETYNTEFSTYAYNWINKYMYKYLENGKIIKLNYYQRKKDQKQNTEAPIFMSINTEVAKEIPDSINVENQVLNKIENQEINNIIDNHLSKKEKNVIQMFYGINNTDTCSVTDIGKKINENRFAVYRIKDKAQDKIKKPLKKYLCI